MSLQDKLNEELFTAAYNGDVNNVKKALGRGGNPNFHHLVIFEWTPLHAAASYGYYNVASELLKAGANPNSTDEINTTPLILAAMNGHTGIVDLLIQSGATVNATDRVGWSPLYYACDGGHVDIIKLLLSKGADTNKVDPSDKTPADYVNPGDKNKAIILEAFQNAIQDPENSTDLKMSSQEMKDYYTRQLEVVKNKELYNAAIGGDVDGVKNALHRGANANFHNPNDFRWTPLHIAATYGYSNMMSELLKAGANPNSTDDVNSTPLHCAATNGRTDVADLLIQSGAIVDPIDKDGQSPLHVACQYGNSIDSGGGHVDTIKLLLSKGADPNIVDLSNKKPADLIGPDDKNKTIILEVLQNAMQDYSGVMHKALKEGHVKVKWSKLATSGAPATGKTSVIKLLLDEPPPEVHDSTLAVTAPEVRRVGTTSFVAGGEPGNSSSPIWNKVDPHSVKHMIAKQIKHGVESSPVTSATKSGGDNELSSSSNDEEIPTSQSSTSPQQSTPKLVSPATSEIVRILPTVEESPELHQSHWVYVVDSGGQAAFLDIAPALLRYNPVSILTLKLNEKLEDRPKFYFSFKGKQIGEPVERQINNMQLLESSFRSLLSTDQPHLCNIHITCSYDKPSLLVLGTFHDKVDECIGETLDDKNAALWSTLSKFRDVRLNYSDGKKKVIFPINTIARGDSEREMAESIRSIVCNSYIEANIPARWYLFQLDLEEFQNTEGTMIVSKKECMRIGGNLMMDRTDVEAALMYYHDLTVFLYFPKTLPNVVFLHPQPLFDKLSELISISFADAVEYLRNMKIFQPPNVHHQLKHEGTFSRDLFDRIPEGFTPEFTADDFLKLMEDIFIVAPLPEKGKFFLPCVLPISDNLDDIRGPFLRNMDSLVLTWQMKPLPQGVFPALVVNLIKRQISPSFDLFKPFDSNEESQQYRNAIQLTCLDLGGAVLLVDAIYWLEIHYSGRSLKCSSIYSSILEGIDAVVKKFRYKSILSIPQERFLCSICPPPRNHLCRPDEEKETLTCCRDGMSVVTIDYIRQYPWIEHVAAVDSKHKVISGVLQMKPDFTDLLSILVDIDYCWEKIGIALKVEHRVLADLFLRCEDNTFKLARVLRSWMDQMPTNITWEEVLTAIEGPIVKHPSTSVKIRKFLATSQI